MQSSERRRADERGAPACTRARVFTCVLRDSVHRYCLQVIDFMEALMQDSLQGVELFYPKLNCIQPRFRLAIST